MLTIEKTNELLKMIGDGSMELDENCCCEIAVSNDFAITLRLSASEGRLYAVSAIGELPENSVTAFALTKIMLKTNFLWDDTMGNTVALADDDTTLVLENSYANENQEPFDAFILRFAENCAYMTALYSDMKIEITENVREEQELDETGSVIEIGDDDISDSSFDDDDAGFGDNQMNFYSAINTMIAA